MERLRAPFLLIAVALAALVVALEVGLAAGLIPKGGNPQAIAEAIQALPGGASLAPDPATPTVADRDRPPGLAIAYLALIDALVLFSLGLIASGLAVPAAILGRVQGAISLVVALVAGLASVALAQAAFALVTLMIVLLSAVPFGTIAYLIRWGSFDVDGAAIVLSAILLTKIALVISLVLAHQRIVANTGLVLLIATSLVGTLIVSALHGFAPSFLVSITDAVGAIVIAVAALVWAVAFLIGAVVSLVRVLAPGRQAE